MIKALIFDFDGTLADSLSIWEDLGDRYLRSQGKIPEEELNKKLETMSLNQAAAYMKEQYGLEGGIRDIVDGINAVMETFYLEEVKLKPGAMKMLDELGARKVPMSIATASDRYLVEGALERLGIGHMFLEIFTCSEVEAGKDEPRIYQAAAENFGVRPEEVLVLEDAYYAARTARSAGFRVCGVFDGYTYDRDDDWVQVCDLFIESWDAGRLDVLNFLTAGRTDSKDVSVTRISGVEHKDVRSV